MKLSSTTTSNHAKKKPTIGKHVLKSISHTDQEAVQALLSLSRPSTTSNNFSGSLGHVDLLSPAFSICFPREGRRHMLRDKRRIHTYLPTNNFPPVDWKKAKTEFSKHLARSLHRHVDCQFFNVNDYSIH